MIWLEYLAAFKAKSVLSTVDRRHRRRADATNHDTQANRSELTRSGRAPDTTKGPAASPDRPSAPSVDASNAEWLKRSASQSVARSRGISAVSAALAGRRSGPDDGTQPDRRSLRRN